MDGDEDVGGGEARAEGDGGVVRGGIGSRGGRDDRVGLRPGGCTSRGHGRPAGDGGVRYPCRAQEPGPGQDARVRPRRSHCDAAGSCEGAEVRRGLAPRHGASGVSAGGGGRSRRAKDVGGRAQDDATRDRVVLCAPQLALP